MDEEDYNYIVSIINELVVKRFSEYILEFVDIIHNPSSGNLVFEFKLCKVFDCGGSTGVDFVRKEIRTIFKLAGLDEKYNEYFFWIDFDYYFVYNKE